MNPFLNQMVMKVDLIWQLVTTSSVVRLTGRSKALCEVILAPKEVMVTVWRSAAGLVHYSFLNPSETINSEKYAQQISNMHQKLQCPHLALVNRRAQFFSTARTVTQPSLQKLNDLGDEVLPHLPYSPDLSPTNYHFFKHLNNFLQEKHFHNQQEAENAFQEFSESWSRIFTLQECVCVQSLSCVLTLSDPMDCSPPDFSVHGVFQARIVE